MPVRRLIWANFTLQVVLLVLVNCQQQVPLVSCDSEFLVATESSALPADNSDDLDNSIAQHADLAGKRLSLTSSDNLQHSAHRLNKEQEDSNKLLQLELRIDRLEFELRKAIHQQQQQQQQYVKVSVSPTANSVQENNNNSNNNNRNGEMEEVKVGKVGKAGKEEEEEHWPTIATRLELMEKFISLTTSKLYETELRVKQLETCECRLSCRLRALDSSVESSSSSASASSSTGGAEGEGDSSTGGTRNETVLLTKRDGEVWQNKCDVCSCHHGQVRCRHIECPHLDCPNPQNVAGKCCPVCYKPCVYKSQTVGHGNKLVINSNQDTCKECMCIDGRLKCQRVDLAHRQLAARSSSSTPIQLEDINQSEGSSNLRHIRTPYDDGDLQHEEDQEADEEEGKAWFGQRNSPGADYASEEDAPTDDDYEDPFDGLTRGRRHSELAERKFHHHHHHHHEALVCPQPDCPLELQFRLENDCCVYCRGFDFCARYARYLCHPAAICVNLNPSQIPTQDSLEKVNNSLRSSGLNSLYEMLDCKCPSGYSGDGKICQEIDECAKSNLNLCDPESTSCINEPAGSYQCPCKPGFKAPEKQSRDAAYIRRCIDVNECADGKLNRCNPRANCINLLGSYKCHCKRGFLGNGFECHKWFSSAPQVAAYLHRHSTSNENDSSTQRPLSTLNDDPDYEEDDDDPSSSASSSAEQLESELRSVSGASQLHQLNQVAKWEPLRLASSESPQQLHATTTQSQPIDTYSATSNYDSMAIIPTPDLNTRTMFFQAPPRFRYGNVTNLSNRQSIANSSSTNQSPNQIQTTTLTATTTTTSNTTKTDQIKGKEDDERRDGSVYSNDKSDTNDSVYTQRSSPTVYQHDSRQVAQIIASGPVSSSISPLTKASQVGSPTTNINMTNSSNIPGYKRGMIIASATTSPSRGHSSSNSNSGSFSSNSNNRVTLLSSSTSNHKSKALGVTSSSSPSIHSHLSIFKYLHLHNYTSWTKTGNHIFSSLLLLIMYQLYIRLNHVITFYFI